MSPPSDSPRTIGYAFAPKKISTIIHPSLLSLASTRNISLIPIDPTVPLTSQGPFHAIIHKFSTPTFISNLSAFSAANPHIPIIDPPSAISLLHDRSTMLAAVPRIPQPKPPLSFTVPRQTIIHTHAELTEPIPLPWPVIAKPLSANGSDSAHKMSLIFRQESLSTLTPPLVLQEFVNHGGVVFKVYVVDEHVTCVKRKSLPDVVEGGEGAEVKFEQISNVAAEGYKETVDVGEAEMPPVEFVKGIADGLRREMGLRLFNFDLIRDVKNVGRYLVIDINYFPGYAKMPGYESVLVDFFCDIVGQKKKGLGEENEKICDDGEDEEVENES